MSSFIVAYCDGSALRNPGPGGFCWYIDNSSWYAEGFAEPVTNNAMELLALAHLLRSVPAEHSLVVRMDSQYAIDCVSKWAWSWRKNNWVKKDGKEIANVDVIKEIFEALSKRNVKLEWVRAHVGITGNEKADYKARMCATSSRDSLKNVKAGPGFTVNFGTNVIH